MTRTGLTEMTDEGCWETLQKLAPKLLKAVKVLVEDGEPPYRIVKSIPALKNRPLIASVVIGAARHLVDLKEMRE